MFVKEALFGYVDHHASCGVENDDEASQAQVILLMDFRNW